MRLGEDNAKLMDRCWGRGLMSVSRGLFWGVRCVLKLSCDDSAQLHKLTPVHWIRHLNRWMFIRCTLQSVKLLKTKTLMIPVILDGQFESQCVCVCVLCLGEQYFSIHLYWPITQFGVTREEVADWLECWRLITSEIQVKSCCLWGCFWGLRVLGDLCRWGESLGSEMGRPRF